MKNFIIISVIVIIVIVGGIFWYRHKQKKKRSELIEAIVKKDPKVQKSKLENLEIKELKDILDGKVQGIAYTTLY